MQWLLILRRIYIVCIIALCLQSVITDFSIAQITRNTPISAPPKRENRISYAYKLLREKHIAEAAVEFSNISADPSIPIQQRNQILSQFRYCITKLRNDRTQTDIFGTLINKNTSTKQYPHLLSQYASILEAQNRYSEMIDIHRQIFSQWPSTQQKYTLAQKLAKGRHFREAYELFDELLNDKHYHTSALSHMFGLLKYFEDRNRLFLNLITTNKDDIENKYDLLRSVLETAIELDQTTIAIDIAVKLISGYPHSANMVLYKLSQLVQSDKISGKQIEQISTQFGNNPTEDQRYVLARLYAEIGSINKAISILKPVKKQRNIEYKANLLYTSGNYLDAKILYQSLLDSYGMNPVWYQKLADISFKEGEIQSAKSYLYKYLKYAQKKNFNTYFYVGKMFEHYGLPDDAHNVYIDGKRNVHDKSTASKEIIKFYLGQKDFRSATEEIIYTQLHTIISPKNLYDTLSDLFFDRVLFNNFILVFDRIIKAKQNKKELSPVQISTLYYCLYIFCIESVDIVRAADYFKKFYKSSSNREDEVFTFSSRLYDEGFTKQAYEILRLIEPTSTSYLQAIRQQIKFLCKMENGTEALEILNQHTQITDPILWASTCFSAGELEQAKNYITHTTHFSAEYFLVYGNINLAYRHFEKARTAYTKIPHTEQKIYLQAQLNIALSYLFDNKKDSATSILTDIAHSYAYTSIGNKALHLRKIIALFGSEDELFAKWITAQFNVWRKDFIPAIHEYTSIICKNPSGLYIPDIRMQLFNLYTIVHQYDKAIEQITLMATQFPKSPLIPFIKHRALNMKNHIFTDIIKTTPKEILCEYPNTFDADIIRDLLQNNQIKTHNAIPK